MQGLLNASEDLSFHIELGNMAGFEQRSIFLTCSLWALLGEKPGGGGEAMPETQELRGRNCIGSGK